MVKVMVKLFGIVFPDICPVCGERATTLGFIGKQLVAPPSLRDRVYGLKSQNLLENMVYFKPRVCEKHAVRIHDSGRVDLALAFCSSLLILATLLLLANILFSAYDALTIPIERYLMLGATSFTAYILLWGIRPSQLERAISIKKVYPNRNYAILKIKYEWYVEEFLRLNPFKAKRR